MFGSFKMLGICDPMSMPLTTIVKESLAEVISSQSNSVLAGSVVTAIDFFFFVLPLPG